MVSGQASAERLFVNAAEQDECIESVTVFRAHCAEVKRRVKLELKQGQNHVDIEGLPTCINEDSIRVEGTGNAIIFDVACRHQPASATPASADSHLELAADKCRRAVEALRKERNIANQQSSYLESYGKAIHDKPIVDVERFLDIFVPRQMAAVKLIEELDGKINEAEKAYEDAQAKIRPEPLDPTRRTKISVTVFAEASGQVELLLTYAVSNASWTPLYDVRASIPQSPGGSAKVALHYRASIMQTTGEDWPDVALILSTASPQLGTIVPTLNAWRIGFAASSEPPWGSSMIPYHPATPYGAVSPMYTPSSPQYNPTSPRFSPASPRYSPYPRSRPEMVHRPVRVADVGALSASFAISGHTSIPSDDDTHKVVITTLDLDPEPEWVCVPREQENVFLQCKVVNSSQFTLLQGEASVYMDGNFVSKSSIEYVSPGDSFKVSLGVDAALRVSYPPVRTLNRIVNRSGFFTGNNVAQSVTAYSQRIAIRNTRATSIVPLRIIDHVPVSNDADLRVNVLFPTSLGPVRQIEVPENEAVDSPRQKSEWADVKAGVKARWAAFDVGGEGTVEWECEIQPNKELELDLAWEVSTPSGKKWENMYNRRV